MTVVAAVDVFKESSRTDEVPVFVIPIPTIVPVAVTARLVVARIAVRVCLYYSYTCTPRAKSCHIDGLTHKVYNVISTRLSHRVSCGCRRVESTQQARSYLCCAEFNCYELSSPLVMAHTLIEITFIVTAHQLEDLSSSAV